MSNTGGPTLGALLRRYLPILEWSRDYSRQALTGDLIAAAIVSIMLIPQSLAYALLVGVPPQVTNAALAAHTLQLEMTSEAAREVEATYGVYLLSERSVWAPRRGSAEESGLAPAADRRARIRRLQRRGPRLREDPGNPCRHAFGIHRQIAERVWRSSGNEIRFSYFGFGSAAGPR